VNDTVETPQMAFNENVHEQNDHGDPERTDEGGIRLKRNWKALAKDRQGRTYNAHVHGKSHELDDDGFLKVRHRGEHKPPASTNQTKAFVDKYREEGYAYRVILDEGGRVNMFTQDDWEVVTDKAGRAEMGMGQARHPNATGVLVKKPAEWFLADQEEKVERNKERFEQSTSPKDEDGQYEATPDQGRAYGTSPLR